MAETMASQLTTDRRRGFTQSGFQKADIKLTLNGKPAVQVCSRGELKMLSWAMVLAQGLVMAESTQEKPVFLVDDLIAELDKERQFAIAELLQRQGGQVVVTGTDLELLRPIWGEEPSLKMFHVEHGIIKALETSE